MRLFFLAVLLMVALLGEESRAQISIDVSGDDGRSGRNGRSYDYPAASGNDAISWGDGGPGSRGKNGGNATTAEPGEHAGNIDVTFDVDESDGVPKMRVSGQIQAAGSDQAWQTYDSGPQPIDANVNQRANGGDGGDGGDSGRGQDGGEGGKGADADASADRDGGNGGRGGPGGNEGDPTSGEDAGHGGHITNRAHHLNTDLLMNESHETTGGRYGVPGNFLGPGEGGAGGDGGDSDMVPRWEDVRQDDGSYQRQVVGYDTNPGGRDGPDGPDGQSSSARVRRGRSSKQGSHQYVVTQADGSEKIYHDRFDLRLMGFEFYEAQGNRNRVFEPGERIKVRNLRFKNTSTDMPTPAGQDIHVMIAGKKWVLVPREGESDQPHLKLPRELGPLEEVTLEEELEFRIAEHEAVPEDPGALRVVSDVDPFAQMQRVNRNFNTRKSQNFTIEYPVEITPLVGMRALQDGEETDVIFHVKNVSETDLGTASEEQRSLQVRWGVGQEGELQSGDIVFRDEKGEVRNLADGHAIDIPILPAGETMIIRGRLQINEGQDPYTALRLLASSHISRLSEEGDHIANDELKATQFEDFTVRVAQSYKKSDGSRYLLIVNNRTTKEEIDAWKELAASEGRVLDVWDLSYNGHLDLSQQFKDNPHILEDFRGDTLIMPNNVFDAAHGEARPDDFLSKRDFLRMLGEYGVRLQVVGDFDYAQHLYPTEVDEATRIDHSSIEQYLERRRAEVADGRETRLVLGPLHGDATMDIDRVPVTEVRSPFGVHASEERLKKFADSVAEDLNRIHPERNYVVTYEFDPEEKLAWFGGEASEDNKTGSRRYIRHGYLKIRRSIDTYRTWSGTVNARDDSIHSREFVLGDRNRFGFYYTMDEDELLDRLREKFLNGEAATSDNLKSGKILLDALKVRLAEEQRQLREVHFKGDDKLAGKMPFMTLLSEFSFPHSVDFNSEEGKLVAEFLAETTAMLKIQRSWYNYLHWAASDRHSTARSLELLEEFQKKAFGQFVHESMGEGQNPEEFVNPEENERLAAEYIEARESEIRAEIKANKGKLSKNAAGFFRALSAKRDAAVHSAAEAFESNRNHVQSAEEDAQRKKETDERKVVIHKRVETYRRKRDQYLTTDNDGRQTFKVPGARYIPPSLIHAQVGTGSGGGHVKAIKIVPGTSGAAGICRDTQAEVAQIQQAMVLN